MPRPGPGPLDISTPAHTPRRPGLILPLSNQFVIVRTKLDSIKGRKAVVSGTMETLDGEKVAEAK